MDFKWIFFIIAGLGGVFWILASANPIRNLMILVAFFYMLPVGYVFYQYTGLLFVDLPILAAIGLALANGQRVKFYFKEITPSFLLLFAWMLFTSSRALETGWGIAEVSKWLRGYLIFVCLANFIKNEKDLRAVLFTVLAGFAFEALIGLYQWRRGSVGLWFLGERLWRPEWWRAYGTFYVPSYFGNFLIMILPFILRLLVFYKPAKRGETYFYGFLVAIGVGALFATYSRGSWLSFIAVVVLMLLFTFFKTKLRPKVKWPIAVGLVFALLFSWKYLPRIIDQFGEQRHMSTMSRVYLGQVALRLIEDNLLFGVGAANYELHSPRYVIPIKEYPTEHLSEMVHNSYLLMCSENGVIGLALFVFVLGQMSWNCLRMFRSNHKLHLNLAVGGLMAIWALCIAFIACPDIRNEQVLNQMYLNAGLVFACSLMERRALAAMRQEQMRKRREEKLSSSAAEENGLSAPTGNGYAISSRERSMPPSPRPFNDATRSRPPRRAP